MLNLKQLRHKYRAANPAEVLENLIQLIDAAADPIYLPPILTVALRSGHTFRAYVMGSSEGQEKEKTFVFSLEIINEGDGASDLCYVLGSSIEAVTVWNVEDYHGALPRYPKKA